MKFNELQGNNKKIKEIWYEFYFMCKNPLKNK